MKSIAEEKTMTTKELAETLGVDVDTVNLTVNRLGFSEVHRKSTGGRPTKVFTEAQATLIKQEIQKHHNLKSRQIEKVSTDLEVIGNAINAFKALQDLYTQKEAEYKATIESQKQQLAIARPKAATYDRIADSSGLKTIQEVAKILHVGSNSLFSILRDSGILYKTNGVNLPHQKYIERGYFEVKEEPYERDGKDFVYTRVFATPKGLLWLEKKIKEGE